MSELFAEETAAAEPRGPLSARLTVGSILLAVLISTIWGTNPTALKIVLRSFPPIGSAGLRFMLAAAGVVLWCRLARVRLWPHRSETPWLLINAGFFVLQIATFTLGVHWGTASHSIVLLHTYPLFVVVLAHLVIPTDRATPWKLAGVGAAFAGIVSLFAGQWGGWQGTQLRGDVIQVVSAFILGIQIIYMKLIVDRVGPERMVFWQMAVGAVAFLVYSLAREGLAGLLVQGTLRADSLVALGYQGLVIGTFCFTVWISLLRRHRASAIAVFGFIGPVVGVALSTLALSEPFTLALGISAALVAIGVALANLG